MLLKEKLSILTIELNEVKIELKEETKQNTRNYLLGKHTVLEEQEDPSVCPKCGGELTTVEVHPDTDMNEMIKKCTQCDWTSDLV